MEIVGILSKAERHRGRLLRSRKILGPPEAVREALLDLSVHGITVDRIVVAAPLQELSEEAQSVLLELANDGKVRIDHLSPHYNPAHDDPMRHGPMHHRLSAAEFHSPAAASNAPASSPGIKLPSRSYLRCKRAIDASVALIFAICFAPLMFAVFMLVLFDVGSPAIFWQQRPGAGGRPIRILKFRTMGKARDDAGRALSDGERVSKIGSLLRRHRLDELPQVYNVLTGHMSLVGPRPLLPVDQPTAPAARLRLRPGLTGWAQIKGGRHLSIEDKAALDIWYINNASFALDMLILAHTIRTVLFGERIDRDAIHAARSDLRHNQPGFLAADAPEPDPA